MSNRKPPARSGSTTSRTQQSSAEKRSPRAGGLRLRDTQGNARARNRDAQSGTAGVRIAAEIFDNLRQNTYLVSIFVLLVVGGVVLTPQVQYWYQQRQKISDVQAQVAAKRASNNQLRNDKRRWEDPVYVRSQARDRLFYVLPGEISYLVVGAETVNANDATGTLGEKLAQQRKTNNISTTIAQTKNNWVTNLVESVVVAGLDNPKAQK